MNWFKGILIFFAFIIFATAITWMSTGLNLAHYSFWAPKQENARREVFEQTKAFQQGTIQELSKMYLQYSDPTTTQNQKDALASVALHQTADFDIESLREKNPQLSSWINSLRNPAPISKF